jgi:hypothetical protein
MYLGQASTADEDAESKHKVSKQGALSEWAQGLTFCEKVYGSSLNEASSSSLHTAAWTALYYPLILKP